MISFTTMVLDRINYYIDQYKFYLRENPDHWDDFKWEALNHFQTHWDILAPDLGEMYDKAINSNKSRKFWTASNYYPKKMMKAFLVMEPDIMKSIFNDLLDESKDAEGRMNRFLIYCDELLKMYKKANKTSVENNHYHDDFSMISLYLAFAYPEKYTLYDASAFKQMLDKLGAKNISPGHDLGRFIKVSRTLYRFLQKDTELMNIITNRLQSDECYQGETMLLVHDFYWCCTQTKFNIPDFKTQII